MNKKPTYEELEQRVKELEREALQGKGAEEELKKDVTELHSL
jgi:Txe/YoeB family toxin of Txe-Axe toxin-antitoxin module